ncbi:MAG: hypothetical protein HQK92_05710 [Nitrospirae bacterium]|nr:hypothetical protein [Nitrospirota bacterium]
MVVKTMKDFMGMATKFVDMNKGQWDHTAWMNFISESKKMGIDMCDDTKTCAGAVLEAMKKYYVTMMGTDSMANVMSEAADSTLKFLKNPKAVASKDEWETYMNSMKEKGIKMSEESQNYLKAMMEATKEFANVAKIGV